MNQFINQPYLNILKVVRVVAKDAGELDAPDLVELLESEAGRPAAVLVPESVAQSVVVELLPDDARQGGANLGKQVSDIKKNSIPFSFVL